MADEEKRVPMRALTLMQEKFRDWRARNFGVEPKETDCFLGVVEEVGELSHVMLKSKQSIRGWDDHKKQVAAKKDAIADIVIFLFGFCDANGWDLGELITEVAKEVLQRDWRKYPRTGRPEPEEAGGD